MAMNVKEYISLSDAGIGCHEPNEMNETECLRNGVKKALIDKRYDCIPSIFKLYAPSSAEVVHKDKCLRKKNIFSYPFSFANMAKKMWLKMWPFLY